MTPPTTTAKPTKTTMVTDRPRLVSVRLSEKEYLLLLEAGAELGLRLSPYIRLAALEKARHDKD